MKTKPINNMNKTLENIIKSKKFDWVNQNITSKNFPTQPIRGKVKIFHFGRNISSEDVIHEMAKEGYEPANIYELLNWKDWNGKDWVVALGSVWRRFYGYRSVPGLCLGGIGRRLSLDSWGGDWRGGYRFAGIKKQESYDKKLKDRILTNLEEWQECWNWKGAKRKDYGLIKVHNKSTSVHRVLYELLVAPIPKGYVIDHLCKNKSCVNPKHLQPVTSKENTLRGTSVSATNARKTHCKRGHELSEANLVKNKRGRRVCKICNNNRNYNE